MYLKKLYKYFGKQINIKLKFNLKDKNYFNLIFTGVLGQVERKYPVKNYYFLKNSNINKNNINLNILSLIINKNNYKSFIKDFEKLLLGVTIGWGTSLNIIGRGFNFKIEKKLNDKNFLRIKIGYSHFIFYEIPSNIYIQLSKKKTKLIIYGLDYWLVWKVARQLRALRSLHTYKLQGILFHNENIVLKPGKQKQI